MPKKQGQQPKCGGSTTVRMMWARTYTAVWQVNPSRLTTFDLYWLNPSTYKDRVGICVVIGHGDAVLNTVAATFFRSNVERECIWNKRVFFDQHIAQAARIMFQGVIDRRSDTIFVYICLRLPAL